MVPCRVLSRALVELHIARGAKVHPVFMALKAFTATFTARDTTPNDTLCRRVILISNEENAFNEKLQFS